MQPRSTACFSIEQGAKMHRLLMPARSTQAARDRLQSLMQSESSATRLIIRPPLIQLPLVIVCYCVLPIWACVNNQKISWGKKAGLMIEDDLKAQQPGKMWKGAGAVQPSVTPAPRQTLTTSRSHMAKRVLPGVTLLLLFCCCYLFTEAVRWDERGEGFCQGVAGGKGFFFSWDDLAQSRRPAERRSSPADRGRAGPGHLWDRHGRRRPACLFLSQMMPKSHGTVADFISTGSTFSHTFVHTYSWWKSPSLHVAIH